MCQMFPFGQLRGAGEKQFGIIDVRIALSGLVEVQMGVGDHRNHWSSDIWLFFLRCSFRAFSILSRAALTLCSEKSYEVSMSSTEALSGSDASSLYPSYPP